MWNFINSHHGELSVIVNFFTAIGTIGAVIVGIFGEQIRARFIRPKISIDLRLDDPTDEKESNCNSSDQKSNRKRDYRIKILNKGRALATNCQLTIEELYKQRSDGNAWEREENFFSAPLPWYDKTNANVLANIGQNRSSYVQFITIGDELDFNDDSVSNNEVPSLECISVTLCFATRSNYFFGPGTYIFEVKTCADNMTPLSNYLEVFLAPSCSWEDMKDGKNFKIKAIDKREFERRCGGRK